MNIKPPKYAEALLKFFLPRRESEFLLGDYDYLFQEILEKKGRLLANLWYWFVVMKAIPSFIQHQVYWGIVMLKSYIKLAMRNLIKRKGYSFINIFGLAIGIACSVLIFGYVQDELSYDRFHENADDLYVATFSNGSVMTPTALAEYLKNEYPEVVKTTRLTRRSRVLFESESVRAFQTNGIIVDADFLSMFSIDLLIGNAEDVLSDPNSIIISESVAAKYFGAENPLGKTLKYENANEFLVSGVFKDYPENSHIKCTFIVSNSLLEEYGRDMNTWQVNNIRNYVQLSPNASVESLNNQISDIVERHREQDKRTLFMQPVTNLRLDPYKDDHGGGTITYVYMFSILALLVLVIACINFVNLTTARSSIRAREVGIRKTIGAHRKQLIYQFFGESLLLTVISLFFAILLVAILLPYFNEIASKNFSIEFILKQNMIYGILGIILFAGILSGSYPALFLSRFQPVKVLSAGTSSRKGGVGFRKVLVVTQFAASIFLILFSLVVFNQVKYLEGRDVGFERENIIYFGIGNKFKNNVETIKSELLSNPKVRNIALMDSPPYEWNSNAGSGDVFWEGKTSQQVKMVTMSVDTDYLETIGLKMAQGRFFSKEYSTDKDEAYVINEAAARAMEMEDPVGKWLKIWDYEKKIIGVVKDFHFESLRNEIIPMVMFVEPDWRYRACVKISSNQIASTIEFIQDKWEEIYPEYPFEYQFLDETLRNHYVREAATGNIVSTFTILALTISCLGLFGLSSYTAEQKTKEIGIRKVLGASALSIIKKISKEFVVLVFISNLIAWPAAYYIGQNWLMDFPYRAPISIWLFVYALLSALVLTIFTISWQIIKAARANPVEALKYE
ncbi:ABC transporter permease [Bacteroidota bacterium]